MKLTAGCLVLLFALPVQSQDDAILRDALRKFNDEFTRSGSGDDEKITAVRALAQYRSDRVVRALSPSLTHGSLKVRMAVARELGGFHNVAAAPEALVVALKTYESTGKKTDGIRIFALRSLGQLKSKDAAPDVDRLILDRSQWVSKAAIDASGLIRSRTSIEPLLKALRRVEGPEGNGEIGINPLADELPPVTVQALVKQSLLEKVRPPSERDVLAEPIVGSLKLITRASCAGAKDWEGWWSKNRATFKVPE